MFSYWGWSASWCVMQISPAYVTIKTAMEWYPSRLVHAARMNGASPLSGVAYRPAAACIPAYCPAAMLIFMDTVGDYGMSSTITAVYSFPTLPYTIYSAICSSPIRFDMAEVFSFYLMIMIAIAMIIQYAAMGKRKFDFLDNGTEQVTPQRIGRIKSAALSAVTFCFCLAALGIPVGSNLIMSFSSSVSIQRFRFTLDNYAKSISNGQSASDRRKALFKPGRGSGCHRYYNRFLCCLCADLFSV